MPFTTRAAKAMITSPRCASRLVRNSRSDLPSPRDPKCIAAKASTTDTVFRDREAFSQSSSKSMMIPIPPPPVTPCVHADLSKIPSSFHRSGGIVGSLQSGQSMS